MASPAPRPGVLPAHLVGGVGGLTFVVVVIAQNLLRAAAPSFGASPKDVVTYYADHGSAAYAQSATYVVSGIALACFAAGVLGLLLDARQARGPALLGGVGLLGIFALFPAMIASDLALSHAVRDGLTTSGTVLALWSLHNGAFCVLLLAIAVALAGLSAAATAVGAIESFWRPLGMLGALLLAVTAALAPRLLDGSGLLAVGLAGFLVWLAFVVRCSVAALRGHLGAERQSTLASTSGVGSYGDPAGATS
jgi:hypothetical protein